ncbi:MAG TPA: GerAB/ArcD/ProY family transporter [Symbiobacteriaceae bacterium]|nr:GerAB/ArcD/ProY family transporter [Symbiobacteriaceae bacterium]
MTRPRISPRQLWVVVLGSLLTTAFYTFPRAAAMATSTAAPWAILLSGGLGFLLFWPVVAKLARHPGKNLVDLAVIAGGRPLAIATALLLGGFFIGSAGISVRQVSEMVVTALYPHTPQTFAMTSLVAVGALGAAASPGGAIWVGSLFVWPMLFAIGVVCVGNLGWGQFRNVIPMSGHGLLPVALQLLPLTSYLDPLVYMAVFCRFIVTPRHLVRQAAYAVGIAVAAWAAVILLYQMVFPLPGGLDVQFPVFDMSRLVQGGRYLERIDALWVFSWTFGSASRLSIALLATALLFQDAFGLPDHRRAVLPLTTAILSFALFPSNQAGAVNFETYDLRQWGFVLVLGLPLAIAVLARIRQKKAWQPPETGGNLDA